MKYLAASCYVAALMLIGACSDDAANQPHPSCYKQLASGGTQYDANLCRPKKPQQ
ncbi:MAG: hypothetical protein ACR2I0_07150 [Rhodoferax sp.]